jgi:hypothetical protein
MSTSNKSMGRRDIAHSEPQAANTTPPAKKTERARRKDLSTTASSSILARSAHSRAQKTPTRAPRAPKYTCAMALITNQSRGKREKSTIENSAHATAAPKTEEIPHPRLVAEGISRPKA